jgi:hypothetical protein
LYYNDYSSPQEFFCKLYFKKSVIVTYLMERHTGTDGFKKVWRRKEEGGGRREEGGGGGRRVHLNPLRLSPISSPSKTNPSPVRSTPRKHKNF